MNDPSFNSDSVPPELAQFTPDEAAALYVAGALNPSELQAMERALNSGQPEYLGAMQRLDGVGDALLSKQDAVQPAPMLKAALMARIEGELTAKGHDAHDAQDAHDTSETQAAADHRRHAPHQRDQGPEFDERDADLPPVDAGFVLLRAKNHRWKPMGVRGVRYRTLVADRKHNRRTILLQMDPGTSLPDHGHAGLEEVYVLTGDLWLGKDELGPGDYFRVPPGVEHATPRSRGGCTAIVISGYHQFPVTSYPRMVWQTLLGWFKKG